MNVVEDGRETLADIARRMRKTLAQGAACEGVVAVEVMRLAERWHDYINEARGLTIGRWLRKYVDPRRLLAWYERKARGYETACKHGIHLCLDSPAASWWRDNVSPPAHAATAKTLRAAYVTGGRVPLNRGQVARLCKPFVSRSKIGAELAALRARIARLEAQVRRLGEVPVE